MVPHATKFFYVEPGIPAKRTLRAQGAELGTSPKHVEASTCRRWGSERYKGIALAPRTRFLRILRSMLGVSAHQSGLLSHHVVRMSYRVHACKYIYIYTHTHVGLQISLPLPLGLQAPQAPQAPDLSRCVRMPLYLKLGRRRSLPSWTSNCPRAIGRSRRLEGNPVPTTNHSPTVRIYSPHSLRVLILAATIRQSDCLRLRPPPPPPCHLTTPALLASNSSSRHGELPYLK